MYLYFFWFLTIAAVVCSFAFVVPVLWLPTTRAVFSKQWSYVLTVLTMLAIPIAAYSIYLSLGISQQLANYYAPESISKRKDMAQVRPIYARLQREAVKADLNLSFDVANLDLILHFATIHSQLSGGVLPPQIVSLLENVLRAAPLQVTALNLLAVHSYKNSEYKAAVNYWQKILHQFTPAMLKSEAGLILTAKIEQTRNLQADEPTK